MQTLTTWLFTSSITTAMQTYALLWFFARLFPARFRLPVRWLAYLGLGAALFFCSDFLIYFRFFCKKEICGWRWIRFIIINAVLPEKPAFLTIYNP